MISTIRAPSVADLIEQLKENTASARTLWQAYSAEALIRRPSPARWSAAECLAHLNLTNRAYLPRIASALSDLGSRHLRGSGPFSMSWKARLLIYWLEPPSRLHLPSTKPFLPKHNLEPSSVLVEFHSFLEQIATQLRAADGLALDLIQIHSPFAEKMKYNLYSALVIITAHNRRHLWQAERALQGV
jgi:hypothetical protein